MSDRFKFRAWDKVRGQYEDCKVYLNTNGKLIDFYGRDERLDGFYIVEQCTGLKDKNGKLIFEGDICSIKGYFYDCEYYENINVDRVELVESLERFFEEAVFQGIYSALGCETLSVEVIGNIHENAELLNEDD